MNHLHHPVSKFERLLIKEKKSKVSNEKKKLAPDAKPIREPERSRNEEQSGRVWRKRTVEQIKEQETEHELQEFLTQG